MKRRSGIIITMTAVLLAGLFACVTINIYFPAEKVESVAGDIVNDIRGQKVPQNDKQSKEMKAFSLISKSRYFLQLHGLMR